MSSVSNGLYFLTLPLVSVMRVIYRKIRHALYLHIKRNVEKVWGARYLSKNTIYLSIYIYIVDPNSSVSIATLYGLDGLKIFVVFDSNTYVGFN